MPDSITVQVPSPRRVLSTSVTVAAVGALLVLGVAVGGRLIATDAITRLAGQGAIQQIRVLGGSVYVGRIVAVDDNYVRLADPAIIRQSGAEAASAPPRLVVEGLAVEPYDVAGELVVTVESIEWASVVRPGSGLDTAYRQAVGLLPPAPVASPS